MKKSLAVTVLLALLLVTVSPAAADRGNPIGMNVSGFSTVYFDGTPIDGSVFGNAALTVLNFWETSCGPCIQEMAHFQQALNYYDSTPEADVQFLICLYTDEFSTVPDAEVIMQEHGYELPNIVIDSVLMELLVEGSWSPELIGFPQTYYINSEGEVLYEQYGVYHSYGELMNDINQWLDQPSPSPSPTPEPVGLPGDLDGDGSVTVSDSLTLLRASMGLLELTEEQALAADADGNGTVDMADAPKVLRIAIGLA